MINDKPTKSNYLSRKFIAFIIWTLLTGFSLFLPKDIPLEMVIQYYGLITLVYISTNVAQKFAEKMPTNKSK